MKVLIQAGDASLIVVIAFCQLSAVGDQQAEPCAPATVLVDGKETAMPVALGEKVPERLGGGYKVTVFSQAGVDCATYLQPSRPIVPDMIEVFAYAGPKMTNVGVNFSSALGPRVTLVREPQKESDIIEMCVGERVSHEIELVSTRPTVTVFGLISAKFCGAAQ